jgi:N-methylhydantoinase A
MTGDVTPSGTIIGADVGGTFTDVVAWDGEEVATAKVPTSSPQGEAAVAGARELTDTGAAFLHGTTTATNALLERRGARTLLVTSPGFEDVIEIGRQDRPSLYDPFVDRAEPLVARGDRVANLDGVDLDSYESVAVSLMYSFVDASGEESLRQRLASTAPFLHVSLSSDVAPEFREFERTSTTVLNAYLQPVVAAYLRDLEKRVTAAGLAPSVSVMRSSGGLLSSESAATLPAAILLSGPAAGALAAGSLATALGRNHVVSFDMGGTSTDVCRIDGGLPDIAYQRAVAGYACQMPSAAVHTVGAGGGSVAWIDSGGSLRVGPRSAGANPGPAAYGRGGLEATVTDANVVLGRIGESVALGGRLGIQATLAAGAVAAVGDHAGLDREAAALGIVRVVEEVMAGAVRGVSIEQGIDPRGATLVAFGGAGGLHATALARALEMGGVIVPAQAGVFSALGLLLSPPRHDEARSVLLAEGDDRLDTEVTAVAEEAGRRASGGSVATSVDVRYLGQSHELTLSYAAGEGWGELAGRFHALHEERNGFQRPGDAIEAVTLRAATAGIPWLSIEDLPRWSGAGDARVGTRQVLTSGGPVEATVWRRDGLAVGDTIEGPAVVEEREATTWLGAGERAVVHPTGALEITW